MKRFMEALATILLTLLTLASTGVSAAVLSGTIYETGPAGTHTLSGATIIVMPGSYRATSAANGTYALSLPTGAYTVTASAAGHLSATRAVAISLDRVLDITLRVAGGASYSLGGTVVETIAAGGTQPLAGALVTASPGGGSVRTDANGTFLFGSLPAGTYTVHAAASGHRGASQRIALAQNSTVVLTLTPVTLPNGAPSTLSGTVATSGGGIAGARVRLTPGNYATTTDASGAFSLTGVPAGSYVAHITATGFRPVNRKISVAAGSTLSVTLTRVGTGKTGRDHDDDDRGNGVGKGHGRGKHNQAHGDD